MPDIFQTADQLRIKHDLDQAEPPLAILARALINKNNQPVLDLSACRDIEDVRTLLGGSGPYLLKDESFTAAIDKAYAVDTSALTVTPAVMPSIVIGGLRFTGTAFDQGTSVYLGTDSSLYISHDDAGGLVIWISEGVTTWQDIVDLVTNDGQGITLAALADGVSGSDLAVLVEGSLYGELSGGSPETSEPIPVAVTLPTIPTEGQYIDLADARGTWGSNPLTVLRNGHKIEGVEADFVNNASGTFFRLLYVDAAIGWRVLASGTKPLNLTAPTITGSPYVGATLTAGNGTWTGSPTSFSYQWQSSADDGDTWTNISGATAQTYALTSGEDATLVRVRVVATNANGPSVAIASLPTEEITIPAFPVGGLVAFWTLNDNGAGGLSLDDSSGNGNTLTNNNGVVLGVGKIGNAAEFTFGSYLSGSAPAASGRGVSLSYWVKTPAMTGGFGGYSMPFNCAGLLGGYIAAAGGAHPAGCPAVDVNYDGVANRVQGTTRVDNNAWNHVCLSCDGDEARLFINGLLDATLSSLTSGSLSPSGPFGINGSGDGSFGQAGDIKYDAVGIWNRALTDLEVATLYNAGGGLEHP